MPAAHWTPIGERNYAVDPGKQELISHWNDFKELTVKVSAVDESGNASGSQSDTVNLSSAGPSNPTNGTIETTDSGTWKPSGTPPTIDANAVEWWKFDTGGFAGYATLKVRATHEGYSPTNSVAHVLASGRRLQSHLSQTAGL